MTEPIKIIIFALMAALILSSFVCALAMHRLLDPLITALRQQHQLNGSKAAELPQRLNAIKERYKRLLPNVDTIDAADFSAGEIECLLLPSRYLRSITASTATAWLRQAPGLLISLGLLGTFFGLKEGLVQIKDTLNSKAVEQSISALNSLVEPMGTAFSTSFWGLLLSLGLLIFTYISGTRDALDRYETLLTSWLETVLPQQLDASAIKPPLRQSIDNLNQTIASFPSTVSEQIGKGMKDAFAGHLGQMFSLHADLTEIATDSMGQLKSVANTFYESSGDFLRAAQAFRQSDFASSLQSSAELLRTNGELLSHSGEHLSRRLDALHDSLSGLQAEWRLIAQAAALELQACRQSQDQISQVIPQLQSSNAALIENSTILASASKQMRETRLEVMRDRRLSIDVAEQLSQRLSADAALSGSCQSFAASLEIVLSAWAQNIDRLDHLKVTHLEALSMASRQDDQALAERARAAGEALEIISLQLRDELGSALAQHQQTIAELGAPAAAALGLSEDLLKRLALLQSRIDALAKTWPARFLNPLFSAPRYDAPPPPPPPAA